MKNNNDKNHKKGSRKKSSQNFVECDNCGMLPVCRPINTDNQPMDLTETFLSRREPVKAGISLFQKDDKLTDIYAVCSGTFKITQITANGEEQILGFRFPGELLGEDAIYPNEHGYTATAVNNGAVCRVQVHDLKSCGEMMPAMQQNIIELLSRQSSAIQQQLGALVARKTAEQQLVAFLLDIAKRNAAYLGTMSSIKLAISREDMANFLGLRRETLSRQLTKLQKNGLLTIKGKQLELLNLDKLTQLANL